MAHPKLLPIGACSPLSSRGPVAVAGDANLTSFTITQDFPTSTTRVDVRVGGNLTMGNSSPPKSIYVVIANVDGNQKVRLGKDAAASCPAIRVGDYLEAEGVKQHEQLFDADDVAIDRIQR